MKRLIVIGHWRFASLQGISTVRSEVQSTFYDQEMLMIKYESLNEYIYSYRKDTIHTETLEHPSRQFNILVHELQLNLNI